MSASVIVTITSIDGEILERIEVEDEMSDIEIARDVMGTVESRYSYYELDSKGRRTREN